VATKQTLTSGYGTGLTDKQKKALSFAVHPSVSDSQDGSGAAGDDMEGPVFGGADANNATPLSLDVTTSLCVSNTNTTHVSLADGVLGQVKRIVHSTRLNSKSLVITPTNFAGLKTDGSAGTNITSDSHRRSITLMYDGDNWQVIAGEITGTAEMVIA
jgi:hypothetical protein|tara:strand:+ start:40 stop:513 length:474 start_codon:yes stop_codon:yes gene_type:complete